MNKTIDITIRNKIATAHNTLYICGNGDFVIHFDFDDEWAEHDTKTARFISGDGKYQDVVFQGEECPVPVISDTYKIKVGVYAGNLRTTTPAIISAKKSILCGGGLPADPAPDVYAQIMSMLDGGQGGGSGGGLTWADLGESKEQETLLLPLTMVNIVSYGSGGRYARNPFKIDLVEGETYTVTYDGVVYECTCEINKWWKGLCLGVNDDYKSLFGQSDGVYPFCYAYDESGNSYLSGTTGEHTISIRGIGTQYNPIPMAYMPVKTAIFKFACYDDYLAGNTDTFNNTFVCTNMTRDEAIQTIMRGQPLDIVYLRYDDSRGFCTDRASDSGLAYNPRTDELSVGNDYFWNANNELESTGGDV